MNTLPLRPTAERYPNQLAFIGNDREVSYQELLQLVEEYSNLLRRNGVGEGDRILWCPNNDLQTLIEFWSLFELGAVACPISSRFPSARKEEIRIQLIARILPHQNPRTWGGTSSQIQRREASSSSPWLNALARDKPATIILSSGSSGQPKASVHSMAAHIASAEGAATNVPLDPGDRWLWSLPAYHVSGFSILVRCAVAAAAIHGTDASTPLSAELLLDADITHLSVVGTQLRRLLAEGSFPNASLKAVLLGGSTNPASLVSAARVRGVPLHTTYGLSETASQVTTSSVNGDPASSGRTLPYRELKVVDSGEIFVKGETLCLGYLRSGIIESVADAEGWFHTGDVGRIENGELFVTGRLDNMFVSGGENIYPETIERALLELPGIEQAIVVARRDEDYGARPVAFIRGESSSESQWADALRVKLRGFEIPVAFLPWPDEIETGIKPNRSKLQAMVNTESPG